MIKVHDRVAHQYYPEKGTGKVLLQEDLYGQSFYLVYFDESKETIRCSQKELKLLSLPIDKAKNFEFCEALPFLLYWEKEKILAEKSSQEIQTINNFKIKPLPHQILAVDYVLNQFKPRTLIADEVGLGKTIEAGLIFEELKARAMVKRVLIIAPSGLCRQWKEEMKQKFFEDFIHYDRSVVTSLINIHGITENAWKIHPQIITSIDFIKPKSIYQDDTFCPKKTISFHEKHIEQAILEAQFDLVIIDEAHKLSKDDDTAETARYKIGKRLAEVTPFFLLLTATPHQGKEDRFRNLLHLIDPFQFYTGCTITPQKVKSITVRNNKRAVTDMEGKRLFKHRITSVKRIKWDTEQDEIEKKLYEKVSEYINKWYKFAVRSKFSTFTFLLFLYQRMLCSSSRAILKSLSKRLDMLTEKAENMVEEHKELFEINNVEELEDLFNQDQVDELEMRLNKRYIFNFKMDLDLEINEIKNLVELAIQANRGRLDSKMKTLLLLLDEFKRKENNPQLKFIIFTEFVQTQKYIQEVLEQHGYVTALINGSLSLDAKVEQRERFKNEAQILISTDAGGEGVNLQFCHVMIQYDLPWNPMRLEQRIGRIDRIGQTQDVKVVNLHLVDTVENRVWSTIEEKLRIIQEEFMQDENKMADILSTLDAEFNFDEIYINAVILRNIETEQLESLAKEMYEKAKEVIKTNEMILPYNDFANLSPTTMQNIQRRKLQARKLLAMFLKTYDTELKTYAKDAQLMEFWDPLASSNKKKELKTVFFDPELSPDYDRAEMLTMEHPYMQKLLQSIESNHKEHNCSAFQIKHPAFVGKKGWCFNYRITLSNRIEPDKYFIISCFIDEDGTYHRRISNLIQSLDLECLVPLQNASYKDYPVENIMAIAQQTAEQVSFEVFKRNEDHLQEKIKKEIDRYEKFYFDRKHAIERIAIDNIRKGLLLKLDEEKKQHLLACEKRNHFIPNIECFQIAFIEFVA